MSEVKTIIAYIPQVVSSVIPYPLIACNVAKIKESSLFEWEDPSRGYEYYDLTRDAKRILLADWEGDESKVDALFSRMDHWPCIQYPIEISCGC